MILLAPVLACTAIFQEPDAPAAPSKTGQHLEDDQLVDYDLGFVFGPAPAEWILWDEETCRVADWDCIALIRSAIDPQLVLRLDAAPTVERDPRRWLTRYASLSYAEVQLEDVEPRLFDGHPAAEAPLNFGEGTASVGHMLVVIHEGWAFSLTLMGSEMARPPLAEQLHRHEELLQLVGKHVPRREAPRGPQYGRDWMLDGRGFRSLSYGFSVEPGPGWTLEGGISAHNTGDWSDLWMHHGDGRYAFLYCLNAPLDLRTDVVARELAELEQRLDPESEVAEYTTLTTTRGELQAMRWQNTTERNEGALRAGLQVGDLVFIVDAYQESGLEPNAEAAAREILEGIQLLRAKELEALRAQLQRPGRGRADAGSDWSDRHGVYTDFRAGYRLRPPGDWRLRVPSTAEWGERVHLHHPDFELYASVEVYEFPVGSSLPAVHDDTISWLLDMEDVVVDEARTVTLGEVHGLRTRAVVPSSSGTSTTYVGYDLVHGRHELEVWFWARTDLWTEEAEAALKELLDAMQFVDGGITKTRPGDRFVDERFGWEMTRPDKSWRGTVETDGWGTPRSDVQWTQGERKVQLTAMRREDYHDPMSGVTSVIEGVRPDLLFRSLASSAEQESVTWGGLAARRVRFPREDLEVTWMFVDGIAYIQVVSGELDDPQLRSFDASFRLYDGTAEEE